MERGQFTFYRSFYDALLSMQKKDREPVIMAICAYALDGEMPELSGTPAVAFSLIKPTLDTGRRKAENGKLGGQAESKPEANGSKRKQNESKRKQTASKKEKEKEGEIEKEKEIENDSYNPPTPLSGVEAAMVDFAEMRKKLRKPLTEAARALTLRELEKLAPGDEEMQVAILNQSIQRGWQGVFPLKDEKPAKGLPKEVKPLKGGDDLDRLERLMGGGA